jgi:hypothetical protein
LRHFGKVAYLLAGTVAVGGMRKDRGWEVTLVEASAVAALVKYFNIALIIAVSLFAAFGVAAFFVKRLRAAAFLLAFCAAAFAALVAEATCFNSPHYSKYFADPPAGVAIAPGIKPSIIKITADGVGAEFVEKGIRFNNINRRIGAVSVNIDFDSVETAILGVGWVDEAGTFGYEKTLYKYLPHENYALIQSCGKVSELTLTFRRASEQGEVRLLEAVINKPIPFYFSGLRLLAVSCLLFALFSLLNKNLRAKAAYYLFEYKFDAKNGKQNIAYACTVALLLLYSWVCVYTSGHNADEGEWQPRQYNEFLVDALIAHRTYLDYGKPERLFAAERPYDTKWLDANGYVKNVDYMWDWAWYKGKYYCYFGVVPAVFLYAPYKMITGDYLSYRAGVFLFCAIAVVLLALLWRYCVKKHMRDACFTFFLFSFPTLFFASGAYAVLRHPSLYTLVQGAGFMFTAAGVFLLLKSIDNGKINYPSLFFACLCLALVFGCRPNIGFVSLLVPVVLWKHRSWKLFSFTMIPYILIAIPLCWYNHVRFESIFDFGANYQLSVRNFTVTGGQNPIQRLVRAFVTFAHYLFCPNKLSLNFPFVKTNIDNGYTASDIFYFERGAAMINFPIVFCLFYMFKNMFDKNNRKMHCSLYASLIIAAIIISVNSFLSDFVGRYALDMAAFVIFPSLFCAYYWCYGQCGLGARRAPADRAIRLSAVYALIAASVFVGLFLFVDGTPFLRQEPTLYRYLEYSLGIIRDI